MTETLEDLEVLPATRSPHGYLASPLTDNIHMTDEGYLVIVGCPIARTGWQKYSVADLPQQRADELGVDVSNPGASIDLYRPAKEVFHPEFLASLNGKPITDGHPPNGEFVDPKNFNKYTCGHIQNVRKGTEVMEDGEVPIIADLVISAKSLIDKVVNKTAREISLGYDFSIDRDGDKIIQCGMLGNHNAVVPKGRAGDLIRIEDAAPDEVDIGAAAYLASLDAKSLPKEVHPAPVEVIETAYKTIKLPPIPTKEKHPVAETKKKDWLRLFKGKHLIELARATDADPEEVMDAAEALNESEVEDKKKAKDGKLPEALKEHQFKAEDMNKDGGAMDAKRKAAHDALDRALDAEEAGKEPVGDKRKAKDEDVKELKKLLDEFLDEDDEDVEAEDEEADPSELEAALNGEDSEEDEEAEGKDDESDPGEEEEASGEEEVGDEEGESPDPESDDNQEDVEDKKAKAKDTARARDAAMATLRMFRPYAARSTDKAFKAAFNKALDSVKKTSRASSGSYGRFATTASARDRAPRNPNPDRSRAADGVMKDPVSKLQAFYDAALKGGK